MTAQVTCLCLAHLVPSMMDLEKLAVAALLASIATTPRLVMETSRLALMAPTQQAVPLRAFSALLATNVQAAIKLLVDPVSGRLQVQTLAMQFLLLMATTRVRL